MVDQNIIGYIRISKKGDLQTFANINYALDPVDPKSIYKYIFTISGSVVYFSKTKQRFVTSSITGGKYIVLSLAFLQVI